MPPLTADTVLTYLREAGHIPTATLARASPLAWGVSNVVLRVEPEGMPALIVKQSQPQLRTKVEWLSRCERIYREADVLRALQDVLPAGVTPRVLFEDRANYVMGLEAVCPGHVVWKQSLRQGALDNAVATRLGLYLALIHSGTWQRPQVLPDPNDWSLFDELRIDPFYRHLARGFPEYTVCFDDLIAEMSAHRVCLVHADFSPKNVLVNLSDVCLVDFETGHFGDGAFDLGFFISHLVLKSLLFQNKPAWSALVNSFLSSYAAEMRQRQFGSECEALLNRSTHHTAACLWARIDGKSPVDYLTNESQRDYVCEFARRSLRTPAASLTELISNFFDARKKYS